MADLLQELQVQIESRHPAVLNISRSTAGSSDPSLTARVRINVQRFERIQARSDVWQSELQVALVQCPDFHQTIENLNSWLDRIQLELSSVEPVNVMAVQSELRKKYSRLQVCGHQFLLIFCHVTHVHYGVWSLYPSSHLSSN
jgi:hypothetical protein